MGNRMSAEEVANCADLQDAWAILDTFKAQAHAAANGNMVLPEWVPSWQIVLEYARLRLLAVAVVSGSTPEVVSALASAPDIASVPPSKRAAVNGSPLILPGR